MPIYSVNQDNTTVGKFLRQSNISPAVKNADTLVPELINCKGVVHYTRSGKRTVVTDEEMEIKLGDFLSVADVCATGDSQTIVAAVPSSDYAFIIPQDDFGTLTDGYHKRKPDTIVVSDSSSINSLDAILKEIVSGNSIKSPVNNVIIATHASGGGFLLMKLLNSSESSQITYEELEEYIENKTRPQISSRVIRNNATIHIRGCDIGKQERFLRLIKKLFNNSVTVTAPKHISNFNSFPENNPTHRFELLYYHFIVFSKDKITKKSVLVDRFVNHKPEFKDVFNNTITKSQFEAWIPARINSKLTATVHPCGNPINKELKVVREFKYMEPDLSEPVYNAGLELESEPADKDRFQLLKDTLKETNTMKSSYVFPEYEQLGYSSYDEFIDGLDWKFSWNKDEKILSCEGHRHVYEVRVPITNEQNDLFINTLPESGKKEFIHQQLLESDSRFFTTV